MILAISTKKNGKFIYILILGFVTGTLDALCATLTNLKIGGAVVFKYVASGYFGKAAMAGGSDMVL